VAVTEAARLERNDAQHEICCGCGLAVILVAGLGVGTPSSAQNAVAVGDIVQTGVDTPLGELKKKSS
jgi:hypothetical protein